MVSPRPGIAARAAPRAIQRRGRQLASATKRRVRNVGGWLIRRAGLLPADQPNGLGEDDELVGTTLPHEVMVFFPDRPNEHYQLAAWYSALRELDKRHRVVIVLQDSRTAKLVRAEAGLDVVIVVRNRTMDDLLPRSNITVALYLNYHPKNYFNLRFTSLVHVHLTHGDSDKRVTISHQITAYDFALVAGRAAVDRLAAHVPFYDAAARCLPIGRPQLDEWPGRVVGPRRSGSTGGTGTSTTSPPTVLYAPTWEGALPSVSYGSVDTHGLALVEAFLADGWRVIYRPHPLCGVSGGAPREADQAIRARLAAASRPPSARYDAVPGTTAASTDGPSATGTDEPTIAHRIDTDIPLTDSFDDADLLVTDISAVAVDWLAVDRPLMITRPARPGVIVAESALTRMAPAITVDDAHSVAVRAREQVEADPLRTERQRLIEYYLGDITLGAATDRFVAAIEHVMAERTREHERLAALRDAG